MALFKLLGPGVLRVGGNGVDTITWNPTGPGNTLGAMSKPDVDALAGFLRATNWTTLYGVNMKTSTATLAAGEAGYAATSLGDRLYGFEIGNEVDLYKSTAVEATWSYANYKTQWESFYAAMRAQASGAAFTGPASASHYATWTVPFASDEGKNVVLLTQHYYRGNGASASSTLALLLAPDPALPTMLQAIGTAATAANIRDGARLTEANSYYNGGATGTSDSFGAALWVLDFLFANAENGSSGVNLHGGCPTSHYSPIADTCTVVLEARPEFYALLLFAHAGTGKVLATKVTSSADVTAHTIAAADGSTDVIVVNKDASQAIEATIDIGSPVSSATVLRLLGPGLSATTGIITLGGSPVTPTGEWAPTDELAPTSGTTVTVAVSAASAVLVRAQ